MKIDNLKDKTYEELRKIASKKKIEGRSKMNKSQLIKSIKKNVKIMKGGDSNNENENENKKRKQYRFYNLIESIIPNDEFVKIMVYPKSRGIGGKNPIDYLLEQRTSFTQINEAKAKPNGAWLSNKSLFDEYNLRWIDFVIEENFANRVYPPTSNIYLVKILNDPSKILRLQTPRDLLLFTQKYKLCECERDKDRCARESFYLNKMIKDNSLLDDRIIYTMINWKAVQDDGYYGIDISPYMVTMRDVLGWYRPWACSSQCIWDHRGIVSVEKLDTTEQLRQAGYTN